jgi:hypothetical protein
MFNTTAKSLDFCKLLLSVRQSSGFLDLAASKIVMHEFNCHWIAGLNERPLAKHWKNFGEQLVLVFEVYIESAWALD